MTQRYSMFEIAVTHGMLVEKKKHAIVPLVKICHLPTLKQHFAKLSICQGRQVQSVLKIAFYSMYTLTLKQINITRLHQFGFIFTLQQLQM